MHNNLSKYWIDALNLKPHPEGGHYREIFSSDDRISKNCLPEKYGNERKFYTSIYFLLEGNEISHFHRIKSDEIWNFHCGSALEIHVINSEGKHIIKKLGLNTGKNEFPQQIVEAGCWFGACLENKEGFALVGCFVSPGFEFDDFELANRNKLINDFPLHKKIIEKLSLH
ncbi:MAG: cupin domain-containing protein [Bacteroidales bacterium]